jgi:hypothetical protein
VGSILRAAAGVAGPPAGCPGRPSRRRVEGLLRTAGRRHCGTGASCCCCPPRGWPRRGSVVWGGCCCCSGGASTDELRVRGRTGGAACGHSHHGDVIPCGAAPRQHRQLRSCRHNPRPASATATAGPSAIGSHSCAAPPGHCSAICGGSVRRSTGRWEQAAGVHHAVCTPGGHGAPAHWRGGDGGGGRARRVAAPAACVGGAGVHELRGRCGGKGVDKGAHEAHH